MMGRREWSKPTGTRCLLSVGAIFALAVPASTDFIEYEQNFAGWQAAAGSYTTIAFMGYPDGTLVTNQYSSLGVTFTSADIDTIGGPSSLVYPQDGWGLDGNAIVELTFSQPITKAGWHFPGILKAVFYLGQTQVAYDVQSGFNGTGANFTGFTGDLQFDRIRLFRDNFPQGNVGLDNLYFQTIPSPGVWVTLIVWAFGGARRRR